MKNRKISGEFGVFHFIRRKRQKQAYDMATIVKIELEKVLEPFKNDLGYTAETLIKNWNLETEIGSLRIKLKDRDKQIQLLKFQLENAMKSIQDYKNNQEKLNEYLRKAGELLKGISEKPLEKTNKVTRLKPDRAKSSQKIGLKSGAKTSKIIKQVKEI